LELDAPETWQVAPDPAPPWKSALAELKFTLPKGFHHVDVLQAPYSPHAAATFRSGFDLSMRKFDVSQAGFQLGPLIKLPQAIPVCLSPGGSRLFMANDRLGASDRSEVAVFDLVAGGAAMRFRWNAFFQKLFLDSFSRDSFELITAVFASDDVLVTIHRNLCAVWDVQAGELRWWTYTESDPGQFWDLGCSGVAVSPGGKQLFFQCDGHLFAVSLADGRVIGKQRSDMVPAQHMTISPDGKSLILCGQTLRQILIESGKKMSTSLCRLRAISIAVPPRHNPRFGSRTAS
jgi:hypothetical protein